MELTDDQLKILKQFRKTLSDVLKPEHTDVVLLKWLRAKNFNLRKSEVIFRQHAFAREVYELDTVVDTLVTPEVVVKYDFTNWIGTAKDGTPLRYVALGRADPIGFFRSLSIEEIARYCSMLIESDRRLMRKDNKKFGRNLNEITYIFDMEGLSLAHTAYTAVLESGWDLFTMLQDHYPEIWKIVIFIKCPVIFQAAFNCFKPIFRTNLLDKIRVVSKHRTTEELLKYVDADVLPECLGGNGVNVGMKFGGLISPEFYLLNHPVLMEDDLDARRVSVVSGSVFNHCLAVREPGSRIRLECRSEGYSVHLAMLYLDPARFRVERGLEAFPAVDEYLDENDLEAGIYAVRTSIKAQIHIAPIDAEYLCPGAGIYVVRFDNRSSWFRTKHIIYRITVTEPATQPSRQ